MADAHSTMMNAIYVFLGLIVVGSLLGGLFGAFSNTTGWSSLAVIVVPIIVVIVVILVMLSFVKGQK